MCACGKEDCPTDLLLTSINDALSVEKTSQDNALNLLNFSNEQLLNKDLCPHYRKILFILSTIFTVKDSNILLDDLFSLTKSFQKKYYQMAIDAQNENKQEEKGKDGVVINFAEYKKKVK